MYIAAAMLSGIQACVNNVYTRMNPRVIQFDNTHFGDLRFSGARPETSTQEPHLLTLTSFSSTRRVMLTCQKYARRMLDCGDIGA